MPNDQLEKLLGYVNEWVTEVGLDGVGRSIVQLHPEKFFTKTIRGKPLFRYFVFNDKKEAMTFQTKGSIRISRSRPLESWAASLAGINLYLEENEPQTGVIMKKRPPTSSLILYIPELWQTLLTEGLDKKAENIKVYLSQDEVLVRPWFNMITKADVVQYVK